MCPPHPVARSFYHLAAEEPPEAETAHLGVVGGRSPQEVLAAAEVAVAVVSSPQAARAAVAADEVETAMLGWLLVCRAR